MNNGAKSIFLAAAMGPWFACQASTRPFDMGDPNLDPHWRWDLDEAYVLHACLQTGKVDTFSAFLPHYTPGGVLVHHKVQPMYPEDGWVLAHRDFGIPGSAQAFPFFTLYNRYRGIFRVMLYNAAHREGSFFQGELYFLDGPKFPQARSALFTFADHKPTQCTLSKYDASLHLKAVSPMTAYDSWAVFDFPVLGYDPDMPGKDPILVFRLTSFEKQALNLKTAGDLQLQQAALTDMEARPGLTATHEPMTYFYNQGLNAYEVAKKGMATYRDVKAFLKHEVLSAAGEEKNKDAFWFKSVKELATSQVGSYIPYVGALASVLEAFVGGSSRASEWEPLKFTGQFQMSTEGAITTMRDLWFHHFFLKAGAMDVRGQRPVQSIDWGIFNFREPSLVVTQTVPYLREGWRGVDLAYRISAPPEVVVNPGCGMDLASLRVAFVVNDTRNEPEFGGDRSRSMATPFMSPDEAVTTGCTVDGSVGLTSPGVPAPARPRDGQARFRLTGLLWELKFKVRAPTREADGEVVILKRTGFRDKDAEEAEARMAEMRKKFPFDPTRFQPVTFP